jgi:hypothetical protein
MFTANLDIIQSTIDRSGLAKTYDYLRPNGFKFDIKDIPNTSFTCQSANLPQLSLGAAMQSTPFTDIPRIGDKLSFGELNIRFLISEDMSNYIELYNWLFALGFPKDYNQFYTYVQKRPSRFPFHTNLQGKTEVLAYSDGTLTVLDSTNVPIVNIIYKNLFPVSLEGLDFEIASASVNYFTAIAVFKYETFEVQSLKYK